MARKSGGQGRRIGRRILLAAGIAGALWFAVQGGEYGTSDLMSQKARRERIEADIAAMQRTVDSLARWKRAVETDPVVQERIAREEFGMVRGSKELLYRFLDSTRR